MTKISISSVMDEFSASVARIRAVSLKFFEELPMKKSSFFRISKNASDGDRSSRIGGGPSASKVFRTTTGSDWSNSEFIRIFVGATIFGFGRIFGTENFHR